MIFVCKNNPLAYFKTLRVCLAAPKCHKISHASVQKKWCLIRRRPNFGRSLLLQANVTLACLACSVHKWF